MGLTPGVNTQWFFTKNWSLYCNGALSLLFGRFHTKEHAQLTSETNRDFIVAHDSFFRNVFAIDLKLGTKWETFFGKKKWHLAFSIGYEIMSWFEQNQLFNYFFS